MKENKLKEGIKLPKKILEKKKKLSIFKGKRTKMLTFNRGAEWWDSREKYNKKRLELITLCIDYRLSYEEIGRLLHMSKQRIYYIYRYGHTGEVTSKKRKEIITRDDNRCLICRTKSKRLGDLHIHHINDPRDNNPENLATLCMSCHMKVDSLKRKHKDDDVKELMHR